MKLTFEQMQQRISLPLEAKVVLSQARIRDWYENHDGMVYVAFSGGLDSTVLLDLVRGIYPHVPAVFNDTGLEYPEIRDFVATHDNVEWLRPKKNFAQVIKDYGYPVVSKEQAQCIYDLRHTKSEKLRDRRLNGDKWGLGKVAKKWMFLLDAPFEISHKCCDWLKKKPAVSYSERTGRVPYLGMRATEGSRRALEYMRHGCNAYRDNNAQSRPLAFWTKDDIWDYIQTRQLSYSRIYDMGYERTGCMFCMFGVQHDPTPNRFQRMAVTHPQLYTYCIETLGLKQVLDYIGVDWRPDNRLPFEEAQECCSRCL